MSDHHSHQSKECIEKQKEQYETARVEMELNDNNLSITALLGASTAIIFSIFSSDVFQKVAGSVASTQIRQLTFFILLMAIVVFWAIEFVVTSEYLFGAYRRGKHWTRLVLKVAQMIRTFVVFLATNFVSSFLLQSWSASRFSAIETGCAIWNIFLTVYFIIHVMKITI